MADLSIITVDGDSMEPLLASGDRVIIDTSKRVPVPPGIFVWTGWGSSPSASSTSRTPIRPVS